MKVKWAFFPLAFFSSLKAIDDGSDCRADDSNADKERIEKRKIFFVWPLRCEASRPNGWLNALLKCNQCPSNVARVCECVCVGESAVGA